MKFLQVTYIDCKTKKPLSEEPAINGPEIPEGISPIFDIQSTRCLQAPCVFAVAESEDFHVRDFMKEVSEDFFFSSYIAELKERAIHKRKSMLNESIEFKGATFSVDDLDKLNSLYSVITTIKSKDNIDFFTGSEIVDLSKSEIKEIVGILHTYVQKCFSWQKEFFLKADGLTLSVETLEKVKPLIDELDAFKVELNEHDH